MARPPRINVPGLTYHVINRGVKQLPLFYDDEDRYEFGEWLLESKRRYGFEIHQYCLLTNHYHFLLKFPEATLSAAMQYLSSHYSRWFNWKYEKVGHTIQGRFQSIPVETDRYYTTVSSYIHLNAVRAGIVNCPEDYLWSNYANLVSGTPDRLADGGIILDYFIGTPEEQRAKYRKFVEEAMGKPEVISNRTLYRLRSWGNVRIPSNALALKVR